MIRVLLADDHPIMLGGLKLIFEDETDIEMVDCVENAAAIVNCLEHHRGNIDIVFTDIKMGHPDAGLEVAEQIIKSKKYPRTHVIFYSMRLDESAVGQAIKMGAQGYLDKGCSSEEILMAVRNVAQKGKSYFSKTIQEIAPSAEALMENMPSPREREILVYLERGLKAEAIAKELFISVHTVRDHAKNIRDKYNAANITELFYILRQKGII
ncbi:MAG: response regulator transcription factor [Bacteroidota bacterium]